MSLPWRPVFAINPPRSTAPTSLLLDTLSVPAKACWWVAERLRIGYTGPLIRVRRASDNALADIPYSAATNKLDEAALIAHCGAGTTNGFIRIIYDQSGNGFDYTQTTAGQQVKIYDTSTGVQKLGNFAAALSDGSNDGFSGADNLGISGAQTLSYFVRIQPSSGATATMLALGHYLSTDEGLYFAYTSATNVVIDMVGGNRQFTATSLTGAASNLLMVMDPNHQVGSISVYQDNVALSQASVTNPTTSLDLQGSQRSLYRDDGTTFSVTGKQTGGIVWAAALTAGDRTNLAAHTWA